MLRRPIRHPSLPLLALLFAALASARPAYAADPPSQRAQMALDLAARGRASLASSAPDARKVRVAVGSHAAAPLRVEDVASRAWVEVSLSGAREAPLVSTRGIAIAVDGYAGGDVVIRRLSGGLEDYVMFRSAPAHEALELRARFGPEVAGLRLVAGTLELLDARGAPRLRMSAPYVVDARGARRAAEVSVSGCAFDANPRAPWGRPATPPGASACTVHVSWSGLGVAYPALVDPGWTVATEMNARRCDHAAAVLPDGHLLVAGGQDSNDDDLSTCEIYDPSSDTWAATGNLIYPRTFAVPVPLADGRILLVGDHDNAQPFGETYDPASGLWSVTGAMQHLRFFAAVSALGDGRVLVAGGGAMVGGAGTTAAEIFDPGTNSWTATAPMAVKRSRAATARLPDGKVLVATGMTNSASGVTATAEVFDPTTETWTATGSLQRGRYFPQYARLANGLVLVTEGNGPDQHLDVAELYDPTTGTWTVTADTATSQTSDWGTVSVLLPNGWFWHDGFAPEAFDPTTALWSTSPPLNVPRERATATPMPDGTVIVAGGISSSQVEKSVEILSLAGTAGPCSTGQECASGVCAGGACCSGPCDLCGTCSQTGSEGTCVVRPAGATCRAAAGACDVAETCDGASLACPVDARAPDGTACAGGTCQAGVCMGGTGSGGESGGPPASTASSSVGGSSAGGAGATGGGLATSSSHGVGGASTAPTGAGGGGATSGGGSSADSGCGCEVAGADLGSPVAIAWLALIAGLRRRRARRPV